jgi:hypothetical protein
MTAGGIMKCVLMLLLSDLPGDGLLLSLHPSIRRSIHRSFRKWILWWTEEENVRCLIFQRDISHLHNQQGGRGGGKVETRRRDGWKLIQYFSLFSPTFIRACATRFSLLFFIFRRRKIVARFPFWFVNESVWWRHFFLGSREKSNERTTTQGEREQDPPVCVGDVICAHLISRFASFKWAAQNARRECVPATPGGRREGEVQKCNRCVSFFQRKKEEVEGLPHNLNRLVK